MSTGSDGLSPIGPGGTSAAGRGARGLRDVDRLEFANRSGKLGARVVERSGARAVRMRRLGPVDEESWRDVAKRCPYATYFHTPEWARLMVANHPGLALAAQAFRLEDDTVAVLPALSYRRERFRLGYESMVPGVYGGPIAARTLDREEVEAILDAAVTVRVSRLHVFGNPLLDAFRTPPETASEFTHLLDLRGGFDAVFARFHRNHRRSYRAAVARGLTADRAGSLDDFRDYFRLYQLSRRRWGGRARTDDPFRLFEAIHRAADPNVVLWLAKLDGRTIAGDLWLYWGSHNVGWHGAADPEHFAARPTNFLLTEIIRDACARGFESLDFNPSAGLEDVARFKDAFGARREYFRHVDRRGPLSRGFGRRLVRRVGRTLTGATR